MPLLFDDEVVGEARAEVVFGRGKGQRAQADVMSVGSAWPYPAELSGGRSAPGAMAVPTAAAALAWHALRE